MACGSNEFGKLKVEKRGASTASCGPLGAAVSVAPLGVSVADILDQDELAAIRIGGEAAVGVL